MNTAAFKTFVFDLMRRPERACPALDRFFVGSKNVGKSRVRPVFGVAELLVVDLQLGGCNRGILVPRNCFG